MRELTIQAYELPTAALEQIEALSQLEKLTVIVGKSRAPLVFHINKLPALRELELSDRWGDTEGNSTLIVAGIEEMQNASRLERLHLSSNNLTNSDVMGLSTLTSLRDLDLSGCSRVNDRAVPFPAENSRPQAVDTGKHRDERRRSGANRRCSAQLPRNLLSCAMKRTKENWLLSLCLAGPGDRRDRVVGLSCPIGPGAGRFPGIRGEFRRQHRDGLRGPTAGRRRGCRCGSAAYGGDWPYAHVVKVKIFESRPVARCRRIRQIARVGLFLVCGRSLG